MQPTYYGQYRYADEASGAPANLYAQSLIPYILSDSLTSSETFHKQLSKAFAEMLGSSESALVTTTRTLTDFLLLKEWVSIRVMKSITWVNPDANANIFDSLYGVNSKGPTLYAGKNILYGGLKPLSSWTTGTPRSESWTNTNGFKYNY